MVVCCSQAYTFKEHEVMSLRSYVEVNNKYALGYNSHSVSAQLRVYATRGIIILILHIFYNILIIIFFLIDSSQKCVLMIF